MDGADISEDSYQEDKSERPDVTPKVKTKGSVRLKLCLSKPIMAMEWWGTGKNLIY